MPAPPPPPPPPLLLLLLLLPAMAVAQVGLKDMVQNTLPNVKNYSDRVVKSAVPAIESLGKKALPTLQNVVRSPEGTQLLLTALPVVQDLAQKSGFSQELSDALPQVQKFLGLPVSIEDFLFPKDTGGYPIGKVDIPKGDVRARGGGRGGGGGGGGDRVRGYISKPTPTSGRGGGGYIGSGGGYTGSPTNSGGFPPNSGGTGNYFGGYGDPFGYRPPPPPKAPPFGRFQNTDSSFVGTPTGFGGFLPDLYDNFGFGQDQGNFGTIPDFGDPFRGFDSNADIYGVSSGGPRRDYDSPRPNYGNRPDVNYPGPPTYERPEQYGSGGAVYRGDPNRYDGAPNRYVGYPSAYPRNPDLGGNVNQYDPSTNRYGGNPNTNFGNPNRHVGYPNGYGQKFNRGGENPASYGGNPRGHVGNAGVYGGNPAGYGGNPARYSGYPAGYGGNPAGYGGNAAGYGGNLPRSNDGRSVGVSANPADRIYRGNAQSYPSSQRNYGLSPANFPGKPTPPGGNPGLQGSYPYSRYITPPSPVSSAPRPGAGVGSYGGTPGYGAPTSGYGTRTPSPTAYTGSQTSRSPGLISTGPYGSPQGKDERLASLGSEKLQDPGINKPQSKVGYSVSDTLTYGNDKITTTGKLKQTDKKTGFSDAFAGQGSLSDLTDPRGLPSNAPNAAKAPAPAPLPSAPANKTGVSGVGDRIVLPIPARQPEATYSPYTTTPPPPQSDQESTPGKEAIYTIRLPDPVVPTTPSTPWSPTPEARVSIPVTSTVSTNTPSTSDPIPKAPDSNSDYFSILLDPRSSADTSTQEPTESIPTTTTGPTVPKAPESGIDGKNLLQQLAPNSTIVGVLQKAAENLTNANIGSILQGASSRGANSAKPAGEGPGPSPSLNLGDLVKAASDSGVNVTAIQEQLGKNPDLGSLAQEASQSGIDFGALQQQLGNNPAVANALKKAAESGFDIGALQEKLASGGKVNLATLQRLLLNKST